MEAGFLKADSTNLPEVNGFMVAEFFVSNADFYVAEFRNVKTSVSSRQTYGDDAVGYVQLRRDSGQCIIKCNICPEHRVHTKSYAATMIVNERDSKIEKVECHDCAASEGGCKHSVALLMWVHRRSEEPSCTSVECYWKKARLAQVGSTIKYVTSKDLGKSAASASIPAVVDVLSHFVAEAQNRKIKNCQLLKHQNTYINENPLSLHYLIIDFRVN